MLAAAATAARGTDWEPSSQQGTRIRVTSGTWRPLALDDVSEGRLDLGLGPRQRELQQPGHRLSRERAWSGSSEFLAVLQPIVDGTALGTAATGAGPEHYAANEAPDTRGGPLPLTIAAAAGRGCASAWPITRLSHHRADGARGGDPRHVLHQVDPLAEACADAGNVTRRPSERSCSGWRCEPRITSANQLDELHRALRQTAASTRSSCTTLTRREVSGGDVKAFEEITARHMTTSSPPGGASPTGRTRGGGGAAVARTHASERPGSIAMQWTGLSATGGAQ